MSPLELQYGVLFIDALMAEIVRELLPAILDDIALIQERAELDGEDYLRALLP